MHILQDFLRRLCYTVDNSNNHIKKEDYHACFRNHIISPQRRKFRISSQRNSEYTPGFLGKSDDQHQRSSTSKHGTACYACVPQGSLCKLKDDLGFLVEQVRQADKVVVAAPAYMLGGHTTIKRVLDRLISLVSEYRNFGPADCVIAVSYGFDGWEGMSKEDLVLFARKFHCNVIGTELMLATLAGDAVKGENLQKLRRLASLLENGSKGLPAPTSEALECPFCSSTALHIHPDGKIRCCVCAGEGKLVPGENGLKMDYDPSFNHHLTHRSLDIHADYLAEKKQLFLDTRKEIKELQAKYTDLDWWVRPKKENNA